MPPLYQGTVDKKIRIQHRNYTKTESKCYEAGTRNGHPGTNTTDSRTTHTCLIQVYHRIPDLSEMRHANFTAQTCTVIYSYPQLDVTKRDPALSLKHKTAAINSARYLTHTEVVQTIIQFGGHAPDDHDSTNNDFGRHSASRQACCMSFLYADM